MPGQTLPTITARDIASRNTEKSCYVTIDDNVYDVTNFLQEHPGGAELILQYGGKDVKRIMDDEISHTHSEAAYEILRHNLIGFAVTEPTLKFAAASPCPDDILPLPANANGIHELRQSGQLAERTKPEILSTTGVSSAADLSRDTDLNADYQKHKFLDLNRPLLMQVWNGGFQKAFYLEQVHRPRHYPGGGSAPLFGNFLEPLSKTPWYVIPIFWLPWVAYGSFLSYQNLPSFFHLVSYWLTGLGCWTLIEYGLHRGLFHLDKWVQIQSRMMN
jgi:4-hydroxysphinganine ceramide fatty acyl 2-hydroxylase